MVNQLAVDWVAPLSNDTVYVVWALAPPLQPSTLLM